VPRIFFQTYITPLILLAGIGDRAFHRAIPLYNGGVDAGQLRTPCKGFVELVDPDGFERVVIQRLIKAVVRRFQLGR
jgi:hypothetical protein